VLLGQLAQQLEQDRRGVGPAGAQPGQGEAEGDRVARLDLAPDRLNGQGGGLGVGATQVALDLGRVGDRSRGGRWGAPPAAREAGLAGRVGHHPPDPPGGRVPGGRVELVQAGAGPGQPGRGDVDPVGRAGVGQQHPCRGADGPGGGGADGVVQLVRPVGERGGVDPDPDRDLDAAGRCHSACSPSASQRSASLATSAGSGAAGADRTSISTGKW
jgi:hypothetical protein